MPETGSSGTVGGLGRKAQPYPDFVLAFTSSLRHPAPS
jgi:hypothetical protein